MSCMKIVVSAAFWLYLFRLLFSSKHSSFLSSFQFATSDIFGIFLSLPHSNRSHFGLIQSMGGGKYICHVFAEYKVSAWSHTI